MKAKLSTRLGLWVGLPAMALFAAVLFFSSQRSVRRVIAETESTARATARYHAARLDGRLAAAARIPQQHAQTLESGVITARQELENYLRSVVEKSPEIYGSCIVFKPYSFDHAEYGYGPYYFRNAEGAIEFVQLASPDYNYFQWPWYRTPRDEGQPIWTEPYFDDGGGGVLMTTRSVPFRRDDAFWGVATIDIALTQLIEEMTRIEVGGGGYAMLISREGRFLAFPDPSKVMKEMLQTSNPVLAETMMSGADGFRRTKEPLRGESAWIAFAPVPAAGFSLALVYPEREILGQAFSLQREQFVLGAIGLLALMAGIYVVARSLGRPISELATAAQRVAAGDLDHRINSGSSLEELDHVTQAFNKMTRDLQMRMQELRYTTTVKERIEGELNAARSIQMSLVPKRFPPFPDRRDIDLHALVKPAREVGGDFYDFSLAADDWLCFFIGDVSGKGVPAALFMAVTTTLLKASSFRPGTVGDTLATVNDQLCGQTDSGMFVSLIFGLLDLRTGALEIADAGHPSPFLLSASGEVTSMHVHRDVALGAMGAITYRVSHVQLQPGDALFLYTDGVTEALNGSREFYAPARLQMALRDLATAPVEKITRGVVQDVQTFAAEHEQSDDISVMAVRWPGPAGSVLPQ
jgi:sigma-B regulation protein RsbU (phosphoserine phosphatase)